MPKTLLIVESPTKAKTISKFLGRDYLVRYSMGHVRDLPKSELGIDIENNFSPKYITIRGKGEMLRGLRDEVKKVDRVLLGSDPDREGEAIAWHLKEYLQNVDDVCRIEFNEITKNTIQKAVKNPRPIDMDRVNAQQGRRVLDRLVGYKLSPLLWKKVKKGLSAGRVQSVAVRLICDREEEIKSFVPEEYWSLTAFLAAGESTLEAKLAKIWGKKADIVSQKEMDEVLAHLKGAEYKVVDISKKEKLRNPVPPFTTSSLQQEAYRKLGFTAKKTMQLAQQLYEGVELGDKGVSGIISYMRTDSTRISEEAQNGVREYIKNKYGAKYVPAKPKQYVSKGKIQNAHEAIRPSSVVRTPAEIRSFLKPPQYKLYKLIWERFVASQMSPAVLDFTTIDINANNCIFRANGSVIKFAGFMQVYIEGRDEDDTESDIDSLPSLTLEQVLKLKELLPKQHFTQPSPRFTEATLVKTLEELGIGRPSTYVPIIDTIITRGYVTREEKHFYPTELGIVVVDLLKENFPNIIDVKFTANMEAKLDKVEEGKVGWQQLLADFYEPFAKTLAVAEEKMEKVQITPEYSGENCEKCGKPMVYKMGRYGKFLACSGFPECHNTKPILNHTGIKCLACGGNIIQRKSKGGRIFYGCDNYPTCRYVAWDRPVEQKCSVCGTQLTEKMTRDGETLLICPNKECAINKEKAEAPKKRGRSKKA